MRLSEINKQSEKYILDESIKTYYHGMVNQAKYLKGRMDAGREKSVVEKELEDFYNEFSDTLPIIRTIFAYDKYVRDQDGNLPTIVGVSKLINSDDETTKAELDKFYKNIILKRNSVKSTYRTFCNEIRNITRSGYKGYQRGSFVTYVLELDDVVKEQMAEFYGEHPEEKVKETFETFSDMGITDIANEMFEANLQYEPVESLNESKNESQLDNYYMVVEMQLFDNEKSSTIPHRNFKNVIATRAKTPAQARKKMKKRMNQSLRELNAQLKSRNMKCACKHKNWDTNSVMHKGYDTMKSKNIKSLSGSDAISTGAYLLKGMAGHGTVQSLPEFAPNRYAIHSSKASVSRYLNKECRDE